MVEPTPPPPDYEALVSRDRSVVAAGATARTRVLLVTASALLVIGGVVGLLVASDRDVEVGVTKDAESAEADQSGSTDRATDEGTETVSPVPTSITWSGIEGFAPVEVVSDGRTFFAVADRGTGTELLTSTDGTTWRSVVTVPFDHLDAAWNGKVLSVRSEQRWLEGRFEGSITVHVVEADGTVTESSVVPVIPDRHERFVGGSHGLGDLPRRGGSRHHRLVPSLPRRGRGRSDRDPARGSHGTRRDG
jgi:hypothetical protein